MSGTESFTRIVVFASGRGTNFRALCAAAREGRLPVRIEALVTNVPGAEVVRYARELGVPVIEVASKGRTREEHELLVREKLEGLRFDWIVLAGYMRLFTAGFVAAYPRILNIHPSLLPAFPGKDSYAQALAYGVRVTGATVHLVGAGLDDGPIVAQRALDVRDDDTVETLTARGLAVEHELYIETLSRLVREPWRLARLTGEQGRERVVWRQA